MDGLIEITLAPNANVSDLIICLQKLECEYGDFKVHNSCLVDVPFVIRIDKGKKLVRFNEF